ncbi:lysylphosphatidylglycerol synthase domain-containing protein [uncultured Acetobacteroides sp.]|uniref:lysylphosphatidylglycerol synthase domain-containing protein n=1 Tax=uncultured Acetobacteroides sp. TaxID=1760811 RepID=UPI0029F48219|nr:lysylphosphatidylglycerol synthase domain-containing protein [uncultured Acetobacteroides sp.]
MLDRFIKKKRLVGISLKVGIAVLCIYLLAVKISAANVATALAQIQHTNPLALALLLAAITLLLGVNLSLETYKWHLFVAPFGVSYFSALKQVLGGMAGGIVSPNRIGDPIIRSFLLPKKFRVRGLLPATFCSFSQLLATAIFGSIALINMSWKSLPGMPKLAITQLILVFLVVVLIWVAMRFFENRIGKIRISKALLSVAISLMRYFVFCTELWLIFLVFSREVRFEPMFFAIALTFLANSAIPSFSFTELGVRAAGASVFFPIFGIDASIAVMSTVLLWVVNVAIPSLPGILYLSAHGVSLSDLRIFKKEAIEKVMPKGEEAER